MATEERVISTKPKIGARPTLAPSGSVGEGEAKPKGKKKLIVIVLAVLLLGGGGGYYFLLGPGAGGTAADGAAAEPVAPAPTPGTVVTVDSISINLSGGHYLRLGLGLQMTNDVAEAPDTARALDLAIALFSGHSVDEVSSPESRAALKAELAKELSEAYEGEVMDVYFTDFVTQ